MDKAYILNLLQQVSTGELDAQSAYIRLSSLPYEDIGCAKLDHHRTLRNGQGEAIFCLGKTNSQLTEIFSHMTKTNKLVIGTKATREQADYVQKHLSDIRYYEDAGLLVYEDCNSQNLENSVKISQPASNQTPTSSPAPAPTPSPTQSPAPYVAVVTGGTADIGIAEEASISLELFGRKVERIYDVGVAGIHRLLDHEEKLRNAKTIIAIAGMEGALPSVIAGLVDVPIIAVPTSVGYGVSEGGVVALLAMLSSCALGVSVVNINNGFGAAYIASKTLSFRP